MDRHLHSNLLTSQQHRATSPPHNSHRPTNSLAPRTVGTGLLVLTLSTPKCLGQVMASTESQPHSSSQRQLIIRTSQSAELLEMRCSRSTELSRLLHKGKEDRITKTNLLAELWETQ